MNLIKNFAIIIFAFVTTIINVASTNQQPMHVSVETAAEATQETVDVEANSPNPFVVSTKAISINDVASPTKATKAKVPASAEIKSAEVVQTEAKTKLESASKEAVPAVKINTTGATPAPALKRTEKPSEAKTVSDVTVTKENKLEIKPETKEDNKPEPELKTTEPEQEEETAEVEAPVEEKEAETVAVPTVTKNEEVSAVSDLSYRDVFDSSTLLDGRGIMVTKRAANLLASIRKDVERQEKAGKVVTAKTTPVYLCDGDALCAYIEVYVTVDGRDYLDCVIENQQEGYEIDYATGNYNKI